MAESKFVLMALLEVENTKIERKRSREKIKIEHFFLLFLIAFNVHKNHFSWPCWERNEEFFSSGDLLPWILPFFLLSSSSSSFIKKIKISILRESDTIEIVRWKEMAARQHHKNENFILLFLSPHSRWQKNEWFMYPLAREGREEKVHH